MNAQRQTQSSASRVWHIVAQVVGVAKVPFKAVTRTNAVHQASRAGIEQHDPARHQRAEELFVRALCDDSNLELDWLWLATQVVREHERRYCFERVLLINPHNGSARIELRQLQPIPDRLQRMAGYL